MSQNFGFDNHDFIVTTNGFFSEEEQEQPKENKKQNINIKSVVETNNNEKQSNNCKYSGNNDTVPHNNKRGTEVNGKEQIVQTKKNKIYIEESNSSSSSSSNSSSDNSSSSDYDDKNEIKRNKPNNDFLDFDQFINEYNTNQRDGNTPMTKPSIYNNGIQKEEAKIRNKKKEKIWYDSDDEEEEKEQEDEEAEEEEHIIENQNQYKTTFEQYIEKTKVESFENDNSAVINKEDIFIFDDELIKSEKKRRNIKSKRCENNIYLPYHSYLFRFSQIDEQKLKKIVTLPKRNIMVPVYHKNLYVLEYKNNNLNMLKRVSLKKKIRNVEEFKESVFMLSFDNYLRTYNMKEDMVYKSRIHFENEQIESPIDIRFFDKEEGEENSQTNLYSIAFNDIGKINVYDTRTQNIVKTFKMQNEYVGMNFHKKSNSLITIDDKGYLYKWCLNTNRIIYKITDNYSVFPTCMNMYKDYLVTCSFNGFLNLFDVNNTQTPIKCFKNITVGINNAIFNPTYDCLLYYTKYLKNGIKLIDLKTNYIYCNFPLQNTTKRMNIYSANFFNNGNNICIATQPNAFAVYDIFNS